MRTIMMFPDMELVIFVGLQASGKSTFFHERFAATHEHVSKDLFRNNRNPNRRQAQLIEDALEEGRSVVVDNTNPTLEDRRALIELGGEYAARIVGYYFDASVRECLRRNEAREGKARVPAPQRGARGQGAGARRGHLRHRQEAGRPLDAGGL